MKNRLLASLGLIALLAAPAALAQATYPFHDPKLLSKTGSPICSAVSLSTKKSQ